MELNFINGNLGKCTTNVEVALQLKNNQANTTNTSITTIKSSLTKLMGIRAAWHQAGHNFRALVLRSSSRHAEFRASPAKPYLQQANTVDTASLLSFLLFSCLSRSFSYRSLSRGLLYLFFLQFLLTKSTLPNHVRVPRQF